MLDFECDGAVVLRGAFDAAGMEEAMWHALASRHRIARDDASTWPAAWFGKLTRFGKSGPFAATGSPTVRDAVTSVLGEGWHEQSQWGQPLITFPMPGPWDVPGDNWHLDHPPATPMPAVRMFAYLTPVRAGGGGTLILTGSHRLAARTPGIRSRDFKRDLASRSEWFRDLVRPVPGDDRVTRFMDDGTVIDGVALRVVELTGEPGDVVLWHPSLLHAIAPNCSTQPRFMLTHTAFRR